MKPKNLKLITKELLKSNVPFTPLSIYKKSKLKISYKTFLRGTLTLMESRLIQGYKISNGRGRGISWIITYLDKEELVKLNELVERKEKP